MDDWCSKVRAFMLLFVVSSQGFVVKGFQTDLEGRLCGFHAHSSKVGFMRTAARFRYSRVQFNAS